MPGRTCTRLAAAHTVLVGSNAHPQAREQYTPIPLAAAHTYMFTNCTHTQQQHTDMPGGGTQAWLQNTFLKGPYRSPLPTKCMLRGLFG